MILAVQTKRPKIVLVPNFVSDQIFRPAFLLCDTLSLMSFKLSKK